jgi:hypothetical protein
LGIPGDEGLIEVKEGNPALRVVVLHRILFVTSAPLRRRAHPLPPPKATQLHSQLFSSSRMKLPNYK